MMKKGSPKSLEQRAKLPQGETTVSVVMTPGLSDEQQRRVIDDYCRLGYITKATYQMVESVRQDYKGQFNPRSI